MDASAVLRAMVERGVSDELLAHAARELLAEPGRRAREARPAAAAPESMHAMAEPRAAAGAGRGLAGYAPQFVRVNVRIDGRRTSLSFPKALWSVLLQRFERRCALMDAVQRHAASFRGRGSRSAWVLDQLEADLARVAAAQASSLRTQGTADLFGP